MNQVSELQAELPKQLAYRSAAELLSEFKLASLCDTYIQMLAARAVRIPMAFLHAVTHFVADDKVSLCSFPLLILF